MRKYDPKQAQKKKVNVESEEYLVSPITGERVPASKVQEHMRIGLLDPRWVEERDKQITKQAVEDQVMTKKGCFLKIALLTIFTSEIHVATNKRKLFETQGCSDSEKAYGSGFGSLF